MKIMSTKSSSQAGWRLFAWVGLIVLVAVAHPSLSIEDHAAAAEGQIEPGTLLTAAPAQLRTQADMAQTVGVAPTADGMSFRPTMGESGYRQAKGASGVTVRGSSAGQAAGPHSPPTAITTFFGVGQVEAGGLLPPDTHGAIGQNQFVQITNTNLNVFSRTGTSLLSVRLANFFGYTTRTIFDPRAVYDSTWNRWVITAEAFPESPTVQFHFVAVSATQDATGPYFVYRIDVNVFNNDDFWDFPQLGMDQDAIIITANVFGPTVFRGARMFAVAKARLYNGLGFSVALFINLVGTLAPPIVLDQNFRTFLVAAPPAGTTVTKYTLENSSRPNGTTLTASTITVPAYTVPPDAMQFGTAAVLDTLDSRFVNASTQNGNSLWNVHTIRFSPTVAIATPRFYEFNTATNTIIQSGFFFASNTSHDFNASIAGNASRDAFVTWSSTDPPAQIQAQKRFSGREGTDPLGVIQAGAALMVSSSFYTQFRWGDYSAVTLDPRNSRHAWIVNELIYHPNIWGSCVGHIGY